MAFYGAIEQLLTGWIFGLLPATSDYFEQAKTMVVETIFAGLEAPAAAAARGRLTVRARVPLRRRVDCAPCKTTS